MMTNEELATAIQNGNEELMCQLWEQCKGFICQQALKWSRAWEQRTDFDIDDLIQSGYIALCDAVRSFQKDRGSFIALLSFHLKTEFSKVAGCRTAAQMKDPSYNAVSLDAPAYNDAENETTLGEVIEAPEMGFEAVEDDLYNQQLKSLVREAVDSIPKQQSKGVDLYYLQGKSQKETAERLCVSGSRAQQVIKEGLKSLRRSQYMSQFVDIYFGSRNYYIGTGYSSYKNSGTSSPEREAIFKEYMENKYKAAQWGVKVSMLISEFGYPIEKAQIIATLDS